MGWLFAAFAVIWIVFFLYAFNLDRKQKALAAEIENMRTKLSSG
jgi:CcmD family protein